MLRSAQVKRFRFDVDISKSSFDGFILSTMDFPLTQIVLGEGEHNHGIENEEIRNDPARDCRKHDLSRVCIS